MIIGCSDDENKKVLENPRKNHVWDSQVQALEKAKDVEQTLLNSEKNRSLITDE